jgi:N-hydroxyarylamine O-acetyltransferase
VSTSTPCLLDLDAYLARTGAVAVPPTERALADLLAAHVRTFPFDNIDVLLEQHPGISLGAAIEKFVGRGRGGYCFEHATLFHAVLLALGYDATLRLARVGDPAAAPRTHLGVVVTLDGRRLLADPGIGIPALGPVLLEDGAVLEGGIWPHRVVRVAEGAGTGWQLWRHRSAGWELMHTTDELPVREVDVAMGHHWTSTSTGVPLPEHVHAGPARGRGRRHPDADDRHPRRRHGTPRRLVEPAPAAGPRGTARPAPAARRPPDG